MRDFPDETREALNELQSRSRGLFRSR